MNGYERICATLNKQKTDYTPSMEILVDKTIIKALTGTDDYMEFCDFLDLDAVVTNTPSSLYRKKILDSEKGIFKNEWGTVRRQGKELVSAIIDYPIKTFEDVYSYEAPDPEDDYRFMFLKELLNRYKGKRLVGMHVHDCFNYPYYLMGMENLFTCLYEEPEAVHRLVEISVEHNIALAKKAISLGADFIVLGDDYGGGNQLLVSPTSFREFFLPGLQRVVKEIKDAGVYCFKHCCGNINSILDDLVSTGIDVLHPLDPSAEMDICSVKDAYPELTVMGGIDCFEPLSKYSLAEISMETTRVLDKVGKNGRFIIASSNSVHSDTRPENYLAMHFVRKNTPVVYT
jgi:uroporphyrinogen decarboxylase